MILDEALTILADDLGLEPAALIGYAAEDDETGWDRNEGRWPIGSIWRPEGQILYALVRALRPTLVVEFGSYYGCSAKHLLKALVKNGRGKLISVDPAPNPRLEWFTAQETKRWQMIRARGEDADLPPGADMVFEDAMHSYEMTRDLVARGVSLHPKLIVSHDAEQELVGADVRAGFLEAVGNIKTVLPDPSDCGLGYWIFPEAQP